MNQIGRVRQRVSVAELTGWFAAGALLAVAIDLQAGDVAGLRGLNLTLGLAALAAMPLPLRLLQLFAIPRAPALRRFLGETMQATLAAILTDTAKIVVVWSLGAALPVLAHSLGLLSDHLPGQVAELAAATPGRFLPVALMLVSVGLFASWAMVLSLHQVAAGDREVWRNMTGGGAFGPPQTAPLLYAPAFGFTVGLFVPMLVMTFAASEAGEAAQQLPMRAHLAASQWAAPLMLATWSVVAAATYRAAGRVPAQVALLQIEAAHARGFARSEHLGRPPRYLSMVTREAPATFIAMAWHRRFPASALATAVLAGAAAWALGDSDSHLATFAACLAVAFYSGGRARALPVAQPLALPAARFLGASEPEKSLRSLGLNLTLPAISAALIGMATGRWLTATLGLALGTALSYVGSSTYIRPLVRVVPLLLAVLALAGGDLP